MTEPKRYIDATESAKMIRRDLASAFPGVKFSVRTSKYSGGASVDVQWTDGPAPDDVNAIIQPYTGATFDGMQDLKEYHDSDLNGERVQYLCDFAFASRRLSPEHLRRVADDWSRRYGVDAPKVLTDDDGTGYLDPNDHRRLPGDCDYITRRIFREAYNLPA